jgi:translocation and assembly module TamB
VSRKINWKKVGIRTAKITGWIFLSVLLLLIAVTLIIQIPSVQNKITREIISSVTKKTGTPVRLERLYISFPKKIVVKGLYVEDQAKDTLLYVGSLGVNTNLLGLFKNRIDLSAIKSEDLTVKLNRQEDSVFSFDYILKALAGDTMKVEKSDSLSKPWVISFGDLKLQRTKLSFHDSLTGTFADASVGDVEVNMDEFDLVRSRYHIKKIFLTDLDANVLQTKAEATDSAVVVNDSISDPLDLDFKEIELKSINARYTHQISGLQAQLSLGEVILTANEIDLNNQIIDLNKVSVTKSFISYHQLSHELLPIARKDSIRNETDVPGNDRPWKINLKDLQLVGNSIQYYDFRQPMMTKGLDFNHIWLSRFELRGKDFEINGKEAKGEIENLSLYDKSGLTINSFHTSFNVNETSLTVSDFILDTPASYVELKAHANFKSLKTIAKDYPTASLNLNLMSSTLGFRDILFFQPALLNSLPLTIRSGASIRAEASLSGKVNQINIDRFLVQAFDSTELKLKGTIAGLPDITKAYAKINLERFYVTDSDIKRILPDTLLPSGFVIPKQIELKADYHGTMNTPNVNAHLTTDQGVVDLIGKMNLDSTIRENYDGELTVRDMQVGNILGDTTIGKLNMRASVHGAGLRMDNLDALFDVLVNDFQYKGYTYNDFKLKGKMNKYFFSGVARLQDKNLDMKLEGDLDYNEEVPSYRLLFDLKNIDMKALNLTDRDLRARGTLDVDLATSDFKEINGNLAIRKFGLYNGKELYTIDSLLFASIDQVGKSEIDIKSDIINGSFKGTINLYSLPTVIRRHFNNYFNLRDTTYDKPGGEQNFKFDLVLKNTDLITEVLVPGLEPFVPGEIKGEFNSEEAKLNLDFGISKIKYNTIGVDSIRLKVSSDKKELKYSYSMSHLNMDTLKIARLVLSGNVADDSIRTKFSILDSLKKEKYVLGGIINSYKNTFQFRFLPDELLLNYKSWSAPPDHYVQITKTEVWPKHFELTRDGQRIAIERDELVVSLIINKLRLNDVSSLVEGVTPIDGTADGKISLQTGASGFFDSRLLIKDFTILEQTWGDLSLNLAKKVSAPLQLDLGVAGNKVNMKVNGQYVMDSTLPFLDLNAVFSKINLEALVPLTMGSVKRMEGAVTGEMKIVGSVSQPDINGFLAFNKAVIVPAALNSPFHIDDEKIDFKNSGIVFNQFDIKDQKNNTARIQGTITNTDFKTFALNLDLNAKNFQLLNSTSEDNSLFYGNVSLSSNIRVRGTSLQPKVNMQARLDDDSDFTFAVPQSEKGVQEQKGIVEFVDKDAVNDPFLSAVKPNDSLTTAFLGIDLNANIELSDKETFNIVVDPATGDKLTVKGKSTLSFSMDPSGEQQLSGRYEISSGSYDFSFHKLVKRNFDIDKGSSITWSGDPLKAILDIRAIYKLETSPMELVSNQLTTTNQTEINRYKQRLPFFVYMQIKGDLATPEISFRITMPQDKQNAFGGSIYAMLMDLNTRESDLNKQVFALLVLKRFIAENPLQSEGGGDIGSTARSSVSKILTDQLNKLSERVKGVQLSFDVKSYDDYSTGTDQGQTQLQLGLSKSLFDERLVVKVSGNVDIEGENTSSQHSVTDYIGDLALEYKLTEDGRFRITGFRNSNYDMIDGELIETGAGLIYIKDYNTLSELFKTDEKDK